MTAYRVRLARAVKIYQTVSLPMTLAEFWNSLQLLETPARSKSRE